MQREVADWEEVFLDIQGLVDTIRTQTFALCEVACHESGDITQTLITVLRVEFMWANTDLQIMGMRCQYQLLRFFTLRAVHRGLVPKKEATVGWECLALLAV